MQVILKKDVDHLGYSGDVVEVRKGYWRNYLRPRGMAEQATDAIVQDLLSRMERRRAAEARNEDEANELAGLLSRTVLTIGANAGPQGKLYGSVGAAEIARAVESARKLRLDPKKIKLDEPFKAVGTYMVPVEVFPGVRAEMKTMVVAARTMTEEEAAAEAAAAGGQAKREPSAQPDAAQAEPGAESDAASSESEAPAETDTATAEPDTPESAETADAEAEATAGE